VRTSVVACVLAALAALGGGWLVGRWCLGVVLIAEACGVVFWAVQRDDGTGPLAEQVPGQQTLHEVIERARAS